MMMFETIAEVYTYHAKRCTLISETIDGVYLHSLGNAEVWFRVWVDEYIAGIKKEADTDERLEYPIKVARMMLRIAQTHFCPVC